MKSLSCFTALVLGCGRIGFEPRDSSAGDGVRGESAGDGAIGDGAPSDVPPATCTYQNCPGTDESCCVGDTTTCVSVGTCLGTVIECNPMSGVGCPQFEHCCGYGFCTAALCVP